MKIRDDIQQNTDEWLEFREGKITGSSIGKLFAKSRKTGEMFDTEKPLLAFYQKAAERLAIGARDIADEDSVSAREWGHIQEPVAIAHAAKVLGFSRDEIAVDFCWEENEFFAESPDAYENAEKPKWAMEVKCLSSANHLKAVAENQYPAEYLPQILNYFLVNKYLEIVYFVMFDPRFLNEKLQLKIFTLTRESFAYEIERMRDVREIAEMEIEHLVDKFSQIENLEGKLCQEQ